MGGLCNGSGRNFGGAELKVIAMVVEVHAVEPEVVIMDLGAFAGEVRWLKRSQRCFVCCNSISRMPLPQWHRCDGPMVAWA